MTDQPTCTRCGEPYVEGGPCRYHPGELKDYDRVGVRRAHRYGRGGSDSDFWTYWRAQVGDEYRPGARRASTRSTRPSSRAATTTTCAEARVP